MNRLDLQPSATSITTLNASPLLLIDIGNTRLKWAFALPEKPLQIGRPVPSSPANIRALAAHFPQLAGVVVSSVVPALNVRIRHAFTPHPLHFVSSESPFLGFAFDYPRPHELGADRLADAVAVHALGRFPALSINCGTATVINVLNDSGHFAGGIIQPGLESMWDSLTLRAARLRKFHLHLPTLLQNPLDPIPSSTQSALATGVLTAFQGGLASALAQVEEKLTNSPTIYLTGGNASFVSSLSLDHTIKPLLTLTGLAIIGERWRAKILTLP